MTTKQHRFDVPELKSKLTDRADLVCRDLYGTTGYFSGRYYFIGNVAGAPGASLHVNCFGLPGKRGFWWDESTGEHGDMLDLIQQCYQCNFLDALRHGARIAKMPPEECAALPAYRGSTTRDSARAFFHSAKSQITGTLAEQYLLNRGIKLPFYGGLRFHPNAYKRLPGDKTIELPALVAPITNDADELIGAGRYFLNETGGGLVKGLAGPKDRGKSVMGECFGHGVKFGPIRPHWCLGEGLENTLSAKMVVHDAYSWQACLTAGSMGEAIIPVGVSRIYAFLDSGEAAENAFLRLNERMAERSKTQVIPVRPVMDDFNDDLQEIGIEKMAQNIFEQAPELREKPQY